MDEQKLNEQLEAYRKLSEQDKNIDVASLMISALQKEQGNQLPASQKRWAYLISIGVPPFGLIFALKFYFSDKTDAKEAAWMCIVLTAVSIVLFLLLGKVLLGAGGGAGVNLNQIEQIKPSDIQQLTQ